MPNKKPKPLKRANGTGCIFKLSGRRRKPWGARVTTGWTDEKQLYHVIGYFESQTEAKLALDKYLVNPIIPSDYTLKDVYDEWSNQKYKEVAKKTIETYEAAWKYLSIYKDEKMIDLKTSHFQKIIDSCEEQEKSRSHMEKIRNVAFALYNHAMQVDIVNKNYAEFIKLPKGEKKEKEIFSSEDIEKMFNDVDIWTGTILIMIYTGMRIGELLTLETANVDIENKTLVGGSKTEAGIDRVIPISNKIMPYIEYWHSLNNKYLITKSNQKISTKYYRENYYYPVLERLNIKRLTPHSCRHTFASIMSNLGADKLSIQKIIGHTDYKFTEKRYTHKDIEQLKKAIDLL